MSGALAGLRVRAGEGLPAAWAAWLLADQGAEVVGEGPDWLGRRRALALSDPPQVVLGDAEGGPGATRVRFVGPTAEGDVARASGLWDAPVGPRVRPIPGPVGAAVAGAWGAIAAVACALGDRPRDAAVSTVAAGLQPSELAVLLTDRPPSDWEPLRWAACPFIGGFETAEGWLYLHAGLASHLARLEPLLATWGSLPLSEATRRDPARVGTPWEAVRLRRALRDIFRRKPADFWEQHLGGAGLCAVRVRPPEAWAAEERSGAGATGPAAAASIRVHGAAPQGWGCGRGGGLPLAGLRVLDWTQVIAGPSAARTLAELGAEVVRVENPHQTAGWADAFHAAFSPGKRLVRWDMRQPSGAAALVDLVRTWQPHIVLDGLRLGVTDRLGFGEPALRAMVPDLVHVRVGAFSGDWSDRPGWEQTAQAATGLQAVYGGARPALVPVPVTDLLTGLHAAFAAVVGWAHTQRGGGGASARVSLADTAAALVAGRAWAVPTPGPRVRRAAAVRASGLLVREGDQRGQWSRLRGPLTLDGAPLPELAISEQRRPGAREAGRPGGRLGWLAAAVWNQR
jgi:crotonobetainyl-CoA:carnitine CoA-transferase CaiB-like acyl-CoA transferase